MDWDRTGYDTLALAEVDLSRARQDKVGSPSERVTIVLNRGRRRAPHSLQRTQCDYMHDDAAVPGLNHHTDAYAATHVTTG
jgi:hypothetical protein